MSIVPLGIEFDGAPVLIVGGGSVGARKARRFANADAHVHVLSPEFADESFGGPEPAGTGFGDRDEDEAEHGGENGTAEREHDTSGGSVELIRTSPSDDPEEASDWLDRVDPLLVVCATDDDDVNDAFAQAAQRAGVLRNRADVAGSEGPGSVVVPATIRDGPVVVSLSTGGRSPALSAYLRDQIEDELTDSGAMAALSGEIRAELKDRGVPPSVRRDAVRAVVADRGVWKALRTRNANARQAAEAVVEAVVGEQGST